MKPQLLEAVANLPHRYEFRNVRPGVETLSGRTTRPRHHHDQGYATVVLSGRVEEVSFAGRMCAGPGDVFLHGRFDCHLDRAESHRALQILRLPWKHDAIEGLFGVPDPDTLVRLAETDPAAAADELYRQLRPCRCRRTDWVDELAWALCADSRLLLGSWAEARDLRPDVVSRDFAREFGVSPKRFRLEARTRLAWREIVDSRSSLTEIALGSGFADLAHLSRSVREFTGHSPKLWRQWSVGRSSRPRAPARPSACRGVPSCPSPDLIAR